METKEVVLKMVDVVKWFPENYLVLDHFNLQVCHGETIQIVSLKQIVTTTLANLLIREEAADEGTIINYTDIYLIPRHFGATRNLSIQDYLRLPLLGKNINKKEWELQVKIMLERFNLSNHKNIIVSQMTPYEQAAVSVAQALISSRAGELIVADLFMEALNDEERLRLTEILLDLLDGRALIFLSSFLWHEEMFNRVIY